MAVQYSLMMFEESINSEITRKKYLYLVKLFMKYYKIKDLLMYAPDMFLNELETMLKEYRDLTLKFRK